MTLDDALQKLTELRAASLAVLWEQADLLADLLPPPQRGKRAPEVGLAAEALVCSATWVRRLYKVGKTFGSDTRYPDVPFVLYLACLRKPDPLAALRHALEHGQSAVDVAQKESGPPCPTCGRRMGRGRR